MLDNKIAKHNNLTPNSLQQIQLAIDFEDSPLPEWLDEDTGDATEM